MKKYKLQSTESETKFTNEMKFFKNKEKNKEQVRTTT